MRFLKWYSTILVSFFFIFFFWTGISHFCLSDLSVFFPSLILLPVVIHLWTIVKQDGNIKKEFPIAIGASLVVLLVVYMLQIYFLKPGMRSGPRDIDPEELEEILEWRKNNLSNEELVK